MSIGEAIGLAGGVAGLGTALWKAFNGIADLRLKIEQVENEVEAQELALNGVRERQEHLQKRNSEAGKGVYSRVGHIENWLLKNTEYQPKSD
jgi:hypothetical protein